jgi:cobalt-precorrin 5A hydrolase / precorrin-3B C17-methyltransferase
MTAIAIVALDKRGLSLAQRLRRDLPDATIHGLKGRAASNGSASDVVAFENTIEHLQTLFNAGETIVGICATGILMRALGPNLSDKRRDPPVLAISGDGASVVPLIGGHHGANDLARDIAAFTGGVAAITTASDTAFNVALDDPPEGWRLENSEQVKPIAAALLADEPVALNVDCGTVGWLVGPPWSAQGALNIRVTDQADATHDNTLIMRPPVLTLGVGCERNTDPAEVQALVIETLRTANLSPLSIACVCSIDLKSDEAAVLALAEHLDAPARFFSAKTLEAESPRLQTPSAVVYQETGCHGVSEGAALAAAGPESSLIVAKTKSKRATCAIARATGDINAHRVGRPRGVLDVVGIGPGTGAWRTPEADAAIRNADSVVGYRLYLDIVSSLIRPGARIESDLGKEEDRARAALTLAADGKRVALVSSGDAGIYALASLVFQVLESDDDPAMGRVAINVIPGVSAMQAAAARAGAPLGHDFCAVSLSDLLTPQDTIRTRLTAAATAGFVTALYNPQSRTRRTLLGEATEIFRAVRATDTPVVIARNLGREDESVSVTTISAFQPDSVDMFTIVIFGGANTRTFQRGGAQWTYTPRGYGVEKQTPNESETL